MSHPEFDLDHWRTTLMPDSRVQSEPSLPPLQDALFSDSPISVVIAEHYRRLAIAGGAALGPRLPVDRFVFGRGEPAERHLTKVNGLPYRPRSRPWPHDFTGRPMTFLAQLSFVDSSDHMNPLPGDVMLIFMRTMRAHLVPMILPLLTLARTWIHWSSNGLPLASRIWWLTCPHRTWCFLHATACVIGLGTTQTKPDPLPRYALSFHRALFRGTTSSGR